ncbi:heavy metal translocating P-type ATPase [Candidatus Epulonipiscium viviparus]|uniref:heavy metal translocating P-type ATPase n=1 Tax=Candidatus Epulonipiscium viviparus TaxID=420336 RepID=UPI00273814E7|nr:cation-translocating P-type ATPase [Candidatus Epulopiscium viviparus]
MQQKLNKLLTSKLILSISGICLIMSILSINMVNFAWVTVILLGVPTIYMAICRFIKEHYISSAVLVSIAIVACICVNDIVTAGEIIFVMVLGKSIQDRVIQKAKDSVYNIVEVIPKKARVITIKNDCHIIETMVDTEEVALESIVRVLPGENFPVDGVIVAGYTAVNQSVITGESLPIDKGISHRVFAGTTNSVNAVDIKTIKTFENSSMQKMIKLVTKAEAKKAPIEKVIDRWSKWVVLVAIITAILIYIGLNLYVDQKDFAMNRALAALITFCPYTLTMITPVAVISAVRRATKQGVVIKSGIALEQMGDACTIAFDKTGTITEGKLRITDVVAFEYDEQKIISIAASVEWQSIHPIGRALKKYAINNNIPILELQDVESLEGKGILAKWDNKTVFAGSERLVREDAKIRISKSIQEAINLLVDQGKIIDIVAVDGKIIGLIGFADKIRKESFSVVAKLRELGVNKAVLLTGDNVKSANFIAQAVGINNVYAELLPEGKVVVVQSLIEKPSNVCMIGDGINDAPALKTANVGIAIGSVRNDVALDAADIVIMGDEITKLLYIKKLSNVTLFAIKFNIILLFLASSVILALSISGTLNTRETVVVYNISLILVLLNVINLCNKKIK